MKLNPEPSEFKPETSTIWSFPVRGVWATHQPDYRGNFAPQIPRNLILAYSKEGETVLDPMVGSGTTLIEARLLGRNGIGFDINKKAVALTNERLKFDAPLPAAQKAALGDVCALALEEAAVDLIVTHPPYADIIAYSEGENPKDLSSISGIPKFMQALRKAAREMHRVLKPGRHCCVLMGDTRKRQHFVPLSHMTLQLFLEEGFILKEEIIKTQHNTRQAPRWKASAKSFGFFLIMHEHLFVFRKPEAGESTSKNLYSTQRGLRAALAQGGEA